MFAESGKDTKGNLVSFLILLQEAKGGEKGMHCDWLSKKGRPQVIFGFNELLKDKKLELEKNIKEFTSQCSQGCKNLSSGHS